MEFPWFAYGLTFRSANYLFARKLAACDTSDSIGKRFRYFLAFPKRCSFQGLDRPRRVKMQDSVKLIRQRRQKIMAGALSFRFIDHANRALQPWLS